MMHADGHPVTHLYRLVDHDAGNDVRFPRLSPAMSHILLEGEKVDFSNTLVKRQAMIHVDKCSGGDMGQRPFLSASTDLGSVKCFGSRKVAHHKAIARIDLFALWHDGHVDQNSFADLSNEKAFEDLCSQFSRLYCYGK